MQGSDSKITAKTQLQNGPEGLEYCLASASLPEGIPFFSVCVLQGTQGVNLVCWLSLGQYEQLAVVSYSCCLSKLCT